MKDIREFGVFLSVECVNLGAASKGYSHFYSFDFNISNSLGIESKSLASQLSSIVSSSQLIVGSTKHIEKLSQSHLGIIQSFLSVLPYHNPIQFLID